MLGSAIHAAWVMVGLLAFLTAPGGAGAAEKPHAPGDVPASRGEFPESPGPSEDYEEYGEVDDWSCPVSSGWCRSGPEPADPDDYYDE